MVVNIENIRIKNIIEDEENKNDDGLKFDDNAKVIEINGKEIGFYRVFFIADRLTLEYNLFSKYRNKGMGTDFVKVVTHLVEAEYPQYSNIHVLIEPSNIASIKVAKANGYGTSDDYDFVDLITSEGGLYLFSRENIMHKEKGKK